MFFPGNTWSESQSHHRMYLAFRADYVEETRKGRGWDGKGEICLWDLKSCRIPRDVEVWEKQDLWYIL